MTLSKNTPNPGFAADPVSGHARLRIGDWWVDKGAREVRIGDVTRTLSPRAIGVLVELAKARGQVVSRDALLSAVWPDVTVTDESLTQAVAELRKVFRFGKAKAEVIGTVPKSGYRLLAPVEVTGPAVPVRHGDEPAMGMEAYGLVVSARMAIVRGDRNAVAEATRLCREAVLIAPDSHLAQAQLSISLVHLALYGGGNRQDLHDAVGSADQAVRCDPRSAEAHAAQGFAYSAIGQDTIADAAFAMCFQLGDRDGEGHYLAARAAFANGRYRTATALALRSAELVADPARPLFLAARAASRIDPVLGCRLATSSRLHLERRLATDPDDPRSRGTMGPALALVSEHDAAHGWLSQNGDSDLLCGIHNVFGYALVGDIDASLLALEEAIDGGYRDPRWLRYEPMVVNLHSDARFERMLGRLHAA